MTFDVKFVWTDKIWYAKCEELNTTLEDGSFDVLLFRIKMAIPEMAELNLGYKGEIRLRYAIERTDVLAG